MSAFDITVKIPLVFMHFRIAKGILTSYPVLRILKHVRVGRYYMRKRTLCRKLMLKKGVGAKYMVGA